MRYETVIAHAFGPLVDETLALAPGMTVVFGPNEAGKSTWHAALYAGLCGMRRARGRPRSEDQGFLDRDRPWDGGVCVVGVEITLEDGRRIELRHNLDDQVDFMVRDRTLGRDCADEITNDGSPDGAVWLGLDRQTFIATACVYQTDLLGVVDRADSLQVQLQRAAATAGRGETAAKALELIAEFHSEHVGLNRSNSTKPLRTLMNQVQETQRSLERANNAHRNYLERQVTVEAIESEYRRLDQDTGKSELAHANAAAEQAENTLLRATELRDRYQDGKPPTADVNETAARVVAAARRSWETRPPDPETASPSLSALQAELADSDASSTLSEPEPAPNGARVGRRGIMGGLIRILRALVTGMRWLLRRSLAPQSPVGEDDQTQASITERQSQRLRLEELIESRQRDAARRGEAEQEVSDAASAVGITGEGAERIAATLEAWESERSVTLREISRARDEWAELVQLLGDRSLSDVERETRELSEYADSLVSRTPTTGGAEAAGLQRPAELDDMRQRRDESRANWERAKGELEQFASEMPSVPEAEDDLSAAQAELDRVSRLETTLATTRTFLEQAEDQVHRDIAPALRNSIIEWLPRITEGRYTDALVDPETLVVQVAESGGEWRNASLLSHGTAEQIYLLLRIAMAQHLTKTDEVCPLILDDVVSTYDRVRKKQVLETLHALSESTQVILFSHEQEVLDWAQDRLQEPRDRLTKLEAPQAST